MVHYRTHKRPLPVSILGPPNPVHIPTSHLRQIHPNIIHPSTPRSRQWSLSLRFPQQDPIHTPLLTHTRHMHFGANILSIFCYEPLCADWSHLLTYLKYANQYVCMFIKRNGLCFMEILRQEDYFITKVEKLVFPSSFVDICRRDCTGS